MFSFSTSLKTFPDSVTALGAPCPDGIEVVIPPWGFSPEPSGQCAPYWGFRAPGGAC